MDLDGAPETVMSFPAGSTQACPSRLIPYGIRMPRPVAGSTAETDVTLREPRVSCLVTGVAMATSETGFTGAVPVPSHPKLIVPIGARRVPSWRMVDACTESVPPAERGSGRAIPPRMVTEPLWSPPPSV